MSTCCGVAVLRSNIREGLSAGGIRGNVISEHHGVGIAAGETITYVHTYHVKRTRTMANQDEVFLFSLHAWDFHAWSETKPKDTWGHDWAGPRGGTSGDWTHSVGYIRLDS